MSFLDALERFGTNIPTEDEAYQMQMQIQPTPTPVNQSDYKWEWQREYDSLRSAANAAMSGYISPYEGTGWGGSPAIINNLERLFEAANEAKLDPNRIFTSDIANLKTIGADQAKIVRLFEAKLKESLTEKGKIGLTESDIEGLQALTAARSAITAVAKEQINVKKNIAELKLKQQQNAQTAAAKAAVGGGVDSSSPYAFGRSFMDDIFNNPIPDNASLSSNIGTETSLSEASSLIDSIVPDGANNVKYEVSEVKPYVVVGDSDEDAEIVAFDSNGNVVPDYPIPDVKITKIDREAGKATDSLLQDYPIKTK